eukprot:2317042-Pyramimonas_sp.AAC.1
MAVPSLAASAPRLFWEGGGLSPAARADGSPAAPWVIPGLACVALVVHVHNELVAREELVGVVSHLAVGFLRGCIAARLHLEGSPVARVRGRAVVRLERAFLAPRPCAQRPPFLFQLLPRGDPLPLRP